MWSEFWQAFGKAFELMGSNNQTLNEIVLTTLKMTLVSSLSAFAIGMPIGAIIAINRFKGKAVVEIVVHTLMALPPVAVGIFIYLLFRGIGPFGSLGLMYTVALMIIAQVVLLVPIATGMTITALTPFGDTLFESAKGLRLNRGKIMLLTMNEGKFELVSVYLYVFARAIAEVGAVQIVGGNILHKTRVMTTTIALSYNTGSFQLAIALAIILLLIALGVNTLAAVLQRGFGKRCK